MDDSPLSITASITGILTFVVAILAFIYVRYNTLRNGEAEMMTVLESVSAAIDEARPVAQGWGDAEEPDHFVQKILTDLYSIEIEILARCMLAIRGGSASEAEMMVSMSEHVPGHLRRQHPGPGDDSNTWAEVQQKLEELYSDQRRVHCRAGGPGRSILSFEYVFEMLAKLDSHNPFPYTSLVLTFVFQFGASPRMVRWYRVRERVLEKMQARERTRSRLLLYQISTAKLLARDQESRLKQQEAMILGLDHQLREIQKANIDTKLCLERLLRDMYQAENSVLDETKRHDEATD
ncbi:hypothetical protein Daus18300_009486 [Diaporthe australafricana]|uniref:Uncharacterized protein n=1 Tax=Diaporthe australafricana TaxID=127596 RepID=A0ABR3WE19_9PEZI